MKRTRLPNHFGLIRYLGAGRRNAYAVHVTAKAEGDRGSISRRKAICYTTSWEEGYQVLVLFHAGVIRADEPANSIREKLQRINGINDGKENDFDPRDPMIRYAKKMLTDLKLIRIGGEVETDQTKYTFRHVYGSFMDHRFGPNAGQKRKKSTKNSYNSAWLKLEPFYHLTLDEVSVDALEARVNLVASWGYSRTTVQRMVTLIHQLYRYAYDRGYCEGRHGLGVEMPAAKEEVHHQDFTDREIEELWEAYSTTTDAYVKDTVRMILIMCYSGFRIKEYETLEFVDGEVPYFRGGLKTAAGKNRIVPVHSRILPLVRECGGIFLCGKKNGQLRRDMKKVLVEIGVDDPGGCHKKCNHEKDHGKYNGTDNCEKIPDHERTNNGGKPAKERLPAGEEAPEERTSDREKAEDEPKTAAEKDESKVTEKRYHTPHSTRHTFSRLCESYDVKEADRRRMMGHSLKGDITNGVYGHRSVAELKREVEKIEYAREPKGRL